MIHPGGGELHAVRPESHVAHDVLVPAQERDRVLPRRAPQPDGAVPAAGRQVFPPGVEGRPRVGPPIAIGQGEFAHLLAGGGIPDEQEVGRGRGDLLAVGTEAAGGGDPVRLPDPAGFPAGC